MGQGSRVVLVNGTPDAWEREASGKNRMEWEFERDHAKTIQPCLSLVPHSNWVRHGLVFFS